MFPSHNLQRMQLREELANTDAALDLLPMSTHCVDFPEVLLFHPTS